MPIKIKKEIKKKKNSIKKRTFQAPKGMPDILPIDDIYRRKIWKAAHDLADYYGFGKIETPIVEETDLFLHGTGQTSEIVQRQMYSFKSPGGDNLSLRPEFTPNIVRAYLENGLFNLPKPVKLFSYGPLFRYEKPQKGRYRQLWQFDMEIIGESDPIYDALIIQMAHELYSDLKIKNLIVEINTIGCEKCRPEWRKKLKSYFQSKTKKLCSDCQRRFKTNILRILDCKNEECGSIAENSPKMLDCLCRDCHNHFKILLEYLEESGLPYTVNHKLVRGLDYYTKTVFEIREMENNLALCGGGRYDYLVENLGGKSTPAIGVGIGVDRLFEVLKEKNPELENKKCKVFLIMLGDLAKKKALKIMGLLRKGGISAAESFSKESLKSQFRQADKMGAPFVVLIGQKEAIDNTAILRDMKSGIQEVVPLETVAEELKKRLKNCI